MCVCVCVCVLESQNLLFLSDYITTSTGSNIWIEQSMDKENLIFVEQHFRSNGQNFLRDVTITMIERTEKNINLKFTTEEKIVR